MYQIYFALHFNIFFSQYLPPSADGDNDPWERQEDSCELIVTADLAHDS